MPTIQHEPMTVGHSNSFHCVYSPSPFHSVKTDVRTDSLSLHPSAREEDTLLPLPPCLHLRTVPKQKHSDRPNNVSSLGPQHPHPPGAKAQFSSPTDVQQLWVTTRLKDGMGSYPNMCCCYTPLKMVSATPTWTSSKSFCLLAVPSKTGSYDGHCLSTTASHASKDVPVNACV